MTFSSFAQAALPPGHSLSAVPAGRPASQSCPPRIPGIAPATRWLPPVSPPEYVAACAARPALRRSTPRARELSGAWKPPAGSCGTASPVRSPTPPPRRVAAKSRGGLNPQAPQTSHPFGSKSAFHNLSVVEQLSYIERIPLCQLFSWASVTASRRIQLLLRPFHSNDACKLSLWRPVDEPYQLPSLRSLRGQARIGYSAVRNKRFLEKADDFSIEVAMKLLSIEARTVDTDLRNLFC